MDVDVEVELATRRAYVSSPVSLCSSCWEWERECCEGRVGEAEVFPSDEDEVEDEEGSAAGEGGGREVCRREIARGA